MKNIGFTIVFLISLNATAQQKAIVKYFTNDGTVKENRADADFIREYILPDSGNIVDLKEFYKNGNIKLLGKTLINDNSTSTYVGDVMNYDTDGKKLEFTRYSDKGNQLSTHLYHKNGKLKQLVEYYYYTNRDYNFDLVFGEFNKIPNVYFVIKPKLIFLTDSLGKTIVDNGNGYAIEKANYLGEDFIEEGNYKDGFKTGEWKGKNIAGTKVFTEKYNKGNLNSGLMEFNDSKYKYTQLFIAPFYGLGNNHIIDAYLNKIDFKKTYTNGKTEDMKYTAVTVLVGKQGKVENVELKEEQTYLWIKNQLTEAILNMPAWKPAKLRGLPVEAKYISSVPIYLAVNAKP